MYCNICKTKLEPILYNDDTEIAWVCKCTEIINVTIRGREYGSRIWQDSNYKQGAKCQTIQPK